MVGDYEDFDEDFFPGEFRDIRKVEIFRLLH